MEWGGLHKTAKMLSDLIDLAEKETESVNDALFSRAVASQCVFKPDKGDEKKFRNF